jgi:hypothetical protein
MVRVGPKMSIQQGFVHILKQQSLFDCLPSYVLHEAITSPRLSLEDSFTRQIRPEITGERLNLPLSVIRKGIVSKVQASIHWVTGAQLTVSIFSIDRNLEHITGF